MTEKEAEKFIQEMIQKLFHASHIVVGTDFTFGHVKRGNQQMLEKYAEKYDYQLIVVERECYHDRKISSTYIRELVQDGDVPGRSCLGIRMRSEGMWNMDSSLDEHLDFRH